MVEAGVSPSGAGLELLLSCPPLEPQAARVSIRAKVKKRERIFFILRASLHGQTADPGGKGFPGLFAVQQFPILDDGAGGAGFQI